MKIKNVLFLAIMGLMYVYNLYPSATFYTTDQWMNIVGSTNTKSIGVYVVNSSMTSTTPVSQSGYWVFDSTTIISILNTLLKQNQFINASGSSVTVAGMPTSPYMVIVSSFPTDYYKSGQLIGNTSFYALPSGFYNVGGSSVGSVQWGNWVVSIATFPPIYSGSNITVIIASGTITQISSGTVSIMGNVTTTPVSTQTVIDANYKDRIPAGIMGDLMSSATVYFYGYGTSYAISVKGGTMTWNSSFISGNYNLDGTSVKDGIYDNFEIPQSSPTYIYFDIWTGTVSFYIRGLQ